MKQTLREILAILFPERVEARIVRRLTVDILTEKIHPHVVDGVVTLLSFSSPPVRACIHEAKFHRNERAFQLLGAILAHHLKECEVEIIIPIPLAYTRQKERGYNQIAKILDATKQHHDILVVENVLFKHKDTPTQTSLGREARLENVQDVFAIYNTKKNRELLRGKHILLLDDVTTTGATLKAAKAALLPLRPASITCLALAH